MKNNSAESARKAFTLTARQNHPWLFGLLFIPYGVASAVNTLLVPYVLRQQGIPVDRIAGVVAVAAIPTVWSFLCSPLVDLGPKRRSWILFAALGSGIAAGVALLSIHLSLAIVTALLFTSSTFSGLYGAASGAVLTTLPASVRGQAGGWVNAGNLGGGALGGGLLIGLADAVRLPILAVCVTLLVALPAVAALLIHEAPRAREAFLPLVKNVARDLKDVFKSRRTLFGLIFFLSPAGSAAVANLISSVGPDYKASDHEVLLISGIAGGLLSAFGSFAGGFICDRMNRMTAYALAGLLCAVFALYLGFAPHTASTYAIGYSGYALAAGFSYAVFTALVLDVLGERTHAAGTGYALMSASGNLPIVYMTALDGVGYKRWGARGLMGVDALAEAGAGIVLLVIARLVRNVWKSAPAPEISIEPAPSESPA